MQARKYFHRLLGASSPASGSAYVHARHRFERYPEDNAAAAYGLPVDDLYGDQFPDFEYTNSS